jgi:hypothetical protein
MIIIENKLPSHLGWLCPVQAPDLTRLGDLMDGGYVVPRAVIDQADGLLSLGLGDNWSFDAAWHSLKPQDPIHLYDGSVSKDSLQVTINVPVRGNLDLKSAYDSFFTGTVQHLVQNVGPGVDQIGLDDCLNRLAGQNIFIKMDIEGGEYALIESIMQNSSRITGMVMEFHFCNSHRNIFQTAVTALQKEYVIVHLHGNNHVDIGAEGLTDCLELTLVRRDLCNSTQMRTTCYLDGLDFSNVAGAEDHRYCF